MKKRQPVRPDLIARIEALEVVERDFLADAGLPPTLLSKMRAGIGGGPRGAASIAKLEKAIAKAEAEARGKAPADSQESAGMDDVAEALLDAVARANTPDECVTVLKHLDVEALCKRLDTNLHRALTASLTERRQQFILRSKDEERAKAGEPMEVEIRNVADWRHRGGCPYCYSTGVIGLTDDEANALKARGLSWHGLSPEERAEISGPDRAA